MDFNKPVFDELRSKGYVIGPTYNNQGLGLFVVINDVAMPIKLAHELNAGRVTIEEIAAGLSN